METKTESLHEIMLKDEDRKLSNVARRVHWCSGVEKHPSDTDNEEFYFKKTDSSSNTFG